MDLKPSSPQGLRPVLKLKKYHHQGNLEEDETMNVDLRGNEDDDEMDLGMIERLEHCIESIIKMFGTSLHLKNLAWKLAQRELF